jgi:stringent starvation protein B
VDFDKLVAETHAAQELLADDPHCTTVGNKKTVLEQFLSQGLVFLHIDATMPGVRVPSDYIGDAALALKFSHKFHRHDLVITDAFIAQTLSFGKEEFYVKVPLKAILAARCFRGQELVGTAEFQVYTGEDYQESPDDEPPRTA